MPLADYNRESERIRDKAQAGISKDECQNNRSACVACAGRASSVGYACSAGRRGHNELHVLLNTPVNFRVIAPEIKDRTASTGEQSGDNGKSRDPDRLGLSQGDRGKRTVSALRRRKFGAAICNADKGLRHGPCALGADEASAPVHYLVHHP